MMKNRQSLEYGKIPPAKGANSIHFISAVRVIGASAPLTKEHRWLPSGCHTIENRKDETLNVYEQQPGVRSVNDTELIIYLCMATTTALFLYVFVNARISRFKKKRVSRITHLVTSDPETIAPMPTDVLSDKETSHKEDEMIDGVKSRFTIIQKSTLSFITLVWIVAVIIPLVGKVPSTVISVIVAVVTVIIGTAAKPFIENFICGIVISFSSQIRVGDTLLIDQQYGTVEDISMTHTRIKTWDWKRYVIPNSRMLVKEFTNLNLGDSRIWAHLEFSVSYDAELEHIQTVAIEAAVASEYFTSSEAPQFWAMRMEKECIVCWIAAWAESPAEAWNLKSDMAIRLGKVFKEQGIASHMSKIDLMTQ